MVSTFNSTCPTSPPRWLTPLLPSAPPDGRALVKLVDPAVLRAARDAKLQAVADKAAKKAASAAAAEAKRLEKLEKGRLPPGELFRGERGAEFSAWDEQGVPTKTKEGEDLPKSRAKKVAKEWDMQKK